MYVNVENSIRNKQNLDIHPDWWKEHESELQEALIRKVEKWTEMLERIFGYENKTIHEVSLINDLKRYIEIITKEEN